MENKSGVNILPVVIGYLIIYAAFELTASITGDPIDPWNAVLISAAVITVTVLVQIFFFKYKLSQIIEFLGIGRPSAGSIVLALIISVLLFFCYPLITIITGFKFSIPENWLWLAAGVFILHGIAEEVLYRGFLFRHLRTGRSFSKAVWLSILFFSVAHIPILFNQGMLVGGTAILLAAVLSFPLSKLYEDGNNTI